MSALDHINMMINEEVRFETSDDLEATFAALEAISFDNEIFASIDAAIIAHDKLETATAALEKSIDAGELSDESYNLYNLAIESATSFGWSMDVPVLSMEGKKNKEKEDLTLLQKAKGKMKNIGAAIWKLITKALRAIEGFFKRFFTARGRLNGVIKTLKARVEGLDKDMVESFIDGEFKLFTLDGRLLSASEMTAGLEAMKVDGSKVSSVMATVSSAVRGMIGKAMRQDLKERVNKETYNTLENFFKRMGLKEVSSSEIQKLSAFKKKKNISNYQLFMTESLPGNYHGYVVFSIESGKVDAGYSGLESQPEFGGKLPVLSKADMGQLLDMCQSQLDNRDKEAGDILKEFEVARKEVSQIVEKNEIDKADVKDVSKAYSSAIKALKSTLEAGIKLNTLYIKETVGYVASSAKVLGDSE